MLEGHPGAEIHHHSPRPTAGAVVEQHAESERRAGIAPVSPGPERVLGAGPISLLGQQHPEL